MDPTEENERPEFDDTTNNQHQDEKNSKKRKSKWNRALLMVLFLIVFGIIETILWLVTILGFIAVVVNDQSPPQLIQFGEKMASYCRSIIRFLSYNTEQKPWPFESKM